MITNNSKVVKISVFILLFSVFMQYLSGYLYITSVTYVIFPVCITLLAGIIHLFLSKGHRVSRRLQEVIIQYTMVAIIIYVLFYLLAGFLCGFGSNPSRIDFMRNTKIFVCIWTSHNFKRMDKS